MSFPYRLRKSDLQGERLTESETWLSNGHWMVKKALLDYDYRIDPKQKTDAALEKALPKATPVTITRTNRILNNHDLDRRRDLVVFVDEKGQEVLFNRRYVEMFEIHQLQGKGETHPWIHPDKYLVIMSVKKAKDAS